MSTAYVLRPNGPEFERFLYASVGEDRDGSIVTVLSTLARLNLDPWKEAEELSAAGREAANLRLGVLLSRFRDVPALALDHQTVARELARLLPPPPARTSLRRGAGARKLLPSWGLVWAVVGLLLITAQVMLSG